MEVLKTDRIPKQSCIIKLERYIFKKIRIGCTVYEDGVKLRCHMKQTAASSFEIKVKRNKTSIDAKLGLYKKKIY